MIYYLYCALIMTGYSACSALLGSYMMFYTGATEIDLGLIFMVQPLTIFLRPFICARADRRQSHQQMLSFFCLFTAIAYFPFIVYPFFHTGNFQEQQRARSSPPAAAVGDLTRQNASYRLETNELLADLSLAPAGRSIEDEHDQLAARVLKNQESLRYWLLIVFHLLGSIGWCGVRSLGDALASNYAKRVGTDFARYRKYGSISYGLCNVSLGFINQDWIIPNFVPSLMVYSASMILLSVLVYAWPPEYFLMSSKNYEDPRIRQEYIDTLPSNSETARHLGRKLCCCSTADRQLEPPVATSPGGHFGENLASSLESSAADEAAKRKHLEATTCSSESLSSNGRHHHLPGSALVVSTSSPSSSGPKGEPAESHNQGAQLSVRQQMRIFGLLLKRDFRILLYLLVIFYGGLVGYSGPNFVFTYINVVCLERGTCNGSELCGLVISAHCVVETIVYLLVDKFRNASKNRTFMLEITFLSLAVHYYFYGFAIEHLSPYFFLIECLHGIEYGINLTSCVELGYHFAREVELLLPELIEKRIISEQDDKELVKKSLMATLSGCYTMAYEGVGTILGCLLMGMVTGHYSFIVTWITIGTLSALGFVVILFGYLIGKCFKIRPEILRIRDKQLAAAAAAATAEADLGQQAHASHLHQVHSHLIN